VDIETILSQAAAARGLNDNQLISHFAALDAEAERLRSEGGHPTQERRIVLGQTFLSEERSRRLAELGQVQGALAASGGFNAPRGSASHLERMAAGARPARSPELYGRGGGGPSSAVVTASASAGGISAGQVLGSREELAQLTSETLRQIAMDPVNFGRKKGIARAEWSYPEERQLGDSISENTKKLDAVCGLAAPRVSRHDGSLVASGGICLPTNVDYSVPTWVTTDRPLRDGLPSFQATRGGIQFVTPPDIGTVVLQGGTASGSGIATTVWPEATDANPAGATKPVWQVLCGSPQQVYVDAIPTRVMMGNMISRFAPEQIAANTEQAIAAAARDAELNLLSKMYGYSNQVLSAQYLGATRDLLASIDLISQGYRYSHRYGEDTGLTAVFPEWAKGIIRADMARELAHDNSGSQNSLAISDAQIEDWLSARGIDVIWTIDALQAGTYGNGGSAIPNQFFPKFTAGGTPQWPGQTSNGSVVLAWLLYVTGTFQFLDGGRLDLGVVRDSILDSTNDYETFVETFESVAFRGNEVYQVQSTILPNGGSAATVAETGYHE
jgi:hypothetical protein